MNEKLTIKQVAEQTGLSAHTLRYYERIGLLVSVARGPNGYREYSAADLEWIEFIRRLRLTGFSIQDMKRYGDLRHQGWETVGDRRALLETHRQKVAAQIDELQQNLAVIDYKIDLYGQLEEQMRQAAHPADSPEGALLKRSSSD